MFGENEEWIAFIRIMNIPDLEFRHLLVFAALLKLRNVTKVARALDMPQPTVSRCLATLRRRFDDPLFVRTQLGMEPTPVAMASREAVEEIVEIYESKLFRLAGFDPSTASREFKIAASDFGHLLVIPRLDRALAKTAPAVRFTAVPLSAKPLIEDLESGEADLAVGGFPNLYAGVLEQRLFSERYVCLVRRNHPSIGNTVSRAEFKRMRHIIVSARMLGHVHQKVEKRLTELCSPSNIRVVSQSFVVSALMVGETDLILTVPSKIGEILGERCNLRAVAPPFDLPGFDVKQYWHQRFHHDPAHQWLRRSVHSLFQ
jgi:DNA-binding transcriptional LysR family regulator